MINESLRDVIHRTTHLSEAKLSMDKPDAVFKYVAQQLNKAKVPGGGQVVATVSSAKKSKSIFAGNVEFDANMTIVLTTKGGGKSTRKGKATIGEWGDKKTYKGEEFFVHLPNAYSTGGKTLEIAVANAVEDLVNFDYKEAYEKEFEAMMDNLDHRMGVKAIKRSGYEGSWEWKKRYKASKKGLITHFSVSVNSNKWGERGGGYQVSVLYPSAYGAMPLENNKTYQYNTPGDVEKALGPFMDQVADKHKNYNKIFKSMEAGEKPGATAEAAPWPDRDWLMKEFGIRQLKTGPKRNFRLDTKQLTSQEFAIFMDVVEQYLKPYISKSPR
jgi:hypothetical protein